MNRNHSVRTAVPQRYVHSTTASGWAKRREGVAEPSKRAQHVDAIMHLGVEICFGRAFPQDDIRLGIILSQEEVVPINSGSAAT